PSRRGGDRFRPEVRLAERAAGPQFADVDVGCGRLARRFPVRVVADRLQVAEADCVPFPTGRPRQAELLPGAVFLPAPAPLPDVRCESYLTLRAAAVTRPEVRPDVG